MDCRRKIRHIELRLHILGEHHHHTVRLIVEIGNEQPQRSRHHKCQLKERDDCGQRTALEAHHTLVPLHERINHIGNQARHRKRQQHPLEIVEKPKSGSYHRQTNRKPHYTVERKFLPHIFHNLTDF